MWSAQSANVDATNDPVRMCTKPGEAGRQEDCVVLETRNATISAELLALCWIPHHRLLTGPKEGMALGEQSKFAIEDMDPLTIPAAPC